MASTSTLTTSLSAKVDSFVVSYGFMIPLIMPWMQELCAGSATPSMRMLYELPETTIPHDIITQSAMRFETIRDSIIPQLFKFINATPDPKKYLTDRFNYYYSQQKNSNSIESFAATSQDDHELTQRSLELFVSSLVSDLITYDHYQRNSMSSDGNNDHSNLKDLLPLDITVIIQYIKMLIWEYHSSILNHNDDDYKYNESLCCNSLLTILNHEYTHHLLIERYHQNVSDFGMFAEYLHENSIALSKFKRTNVEKQNYVKQLQDQIHGLKRNQAKLKKRPSSQSLPQRGQKEAPEAPLPTINRLDIHAVHSIPSQAIQQEISWQPLEEMYELFEPRNKNNKPFQRIRESEQIPPAPKQGLPPMHNKPKTMPFKSQLKYKIIPKKESPNIKKRIPLPQPPRALKPITLNYKGKPDTTQHTHATQINSRNKSTSKPTTPRRIRTMTLSRPAKLESLSKDEFMGKYLVEGSKIIGKGSFARIYRCKKKNQSTILAMKIVKKQKANKDDVRAMRREISALALVYHENVIRIHDWCETSQHIFIVLDYCGGGNVFDRVMEQQTFTEIQASKLIKQVADALKHIHSLGIVHRDLKPENLMYTGPHYDQLKVIDFGLSNRIKINGMFISQTDLNKKNIAPEWVFSLTTPCGTPHYAAPELIKNHKYGAPVDLWALGVIIYMLLCGFPPFFDTNIKNMFYQIKKAKFHFPSPFWDGISDAAKDLIRKLLVVDATKRYTAEQTLNDPWITGQIVMNEDYPDNLPVPPSHESIRVHDVTINPLFVDNHTANNIDSSPISSSPTGRVKVTKSKRKRIQASDVSSASSPTIFGDGTSILSTIESTTNISVSNLSQSSVVIYDHEKPPNINVDDADGDGNKDGVYGRPIFEDIEDAKTNMNSRSVQLIQSKSQPLQSPSNPPVPFQLFSDSPSDVQRQQMDDIQPKETAFAVKKKTSRPRVDTRGSNKVAYMVDGTIFQIQKKQINKLKLEIQQEQKNLEKLSNQLQKERRAFMEDRETFERDKVEWVEKKDEWMNEHQHLRDLKFELNEIVNKFLTFQTNRV